MKRLLTVILCASMLLASPFGGREAGFARAETENTGNTERETAQTLSDGKAEDSLLLPSSYEEYLPLSAPSDIAVTKEYAAVADGSFIYVYDRKADAYSRYEHTANADPANNTIAKLQFSEEGTLYFLDASTCLYAFDPALLKAEKTDLVCSSFTIFSDTIYFTNVSATPTPIFKTTLNRLDNAQATQATDSTVTSKPAITHDNGVLFYTDSGKYLHKSEKRETDFHLSPTLTSTETVVSIAVYSGILYYTDTANSLYIYDLSTFGVLESFAGDFSAISVYDGFIYVVDGDRIRRYSPEEEAFTDYQICASSPAKNRLSGARKTVLAEDLLLFADNGNDRLSVLDTKTGSYRTIPCGIAPTLLASDGKTALAANGTEAVLYDLTDGETFGTKLQEFGGFNSSLVGVSGIYDNYYFVTDNNYFYRAGKGADGVWKLDSTPKPSVSHTARLLTQDVYGQLYVAYSDGKVFRFTEETFMNPADTGEEAGAVPVQAEQIAVDYEETVYALYKNELYVCADAQEKYSLSKTLVYAQTLETQAISFAFGIEDGGVYLLYEGDFAIKTYDVPLPTVKAIAVDGADEDIFSNENADFSIVETAGNALMVEFDIQTLSGAQVFPYLSYRRETQPKTALKLGETEKYNLIAVFDETNRSYSTALILKRYCKEIPESDYLKPPSGFKDGTGYLTNAVPVYKYPYLTELLTVCTPPKNAAVEVLGEIDRLDYKYYYVSYTDETGAERKGYIPKSYVTNFNGAPPEAERAEYGAGDTDRDSLWRMAFLLLGCASICVLVDYMILHKKKN